MECELRHAMCPLIFFLFIACNGARLEPSRRDDPTKKEDKPAPTAPVDAPKTDDGQGIQGDEGEKAADPTMVAGAFLADIGPATDAPAGYDVAGYDSYGVGFFNDDGKKTPFAVVNLLVNFELKDGSIKHAVLAPAKQTSPWLAYFHLKKGRLDELSSLSVLGEQITGDTQSVKIKDGSSSTTSSPMGNPITNFDYVPKPTAVDPKLPPISVQIIQPPSDSDDDDFEPDPS